MLETAALTLDGYAFDAKVRARLSERYGQVAPLERQIIQFLAVLYEPVSRQIIVSCLTKLGIVNEQGQPYKTPPISAAINRLLEQDLLIQERQQGPRCHPMLRERVLRETLATAQFEKIVAVIEEQRPVKLQMSSNLARYSTHFEFIRDVRIALYCEDWEKIQRCAAAFQSSYRGYEQVSVLDIIREVCRNPFDADFIYDLPEALQALCLTSLLKDSLARCEADPEAFDVLQGLCEDSLPEERTESFVDLLSLYIEQLLLREDLQGAKLALDQLDEQHLVELGTFEGWIFLLEGDIDEALACYRVALKADLRQRNKRKGGLSGLCGCLFVLALLKQGSPQAVQEAIAYSEPLVPYGQHRFGEIYAPLTLWAKVQRGDLEAKTRLRQSLHRPSPDQHPVKTLLHSLCLYWADPNAAAAKLQSVLEPLCEACQAAGYYWLVMEAAEILSRVSADETSQYVLLAEVLREQSELPPLVDLFPVQEPWETQLQALENLYLPSSTPSGGLRQTEQRLAWFLTRRSETAWQLQPREQRLTAKGTWSKGRNVALKRLSRTPDEVGYLTPQDLSVCRCIEREQYGRWGSEQYQFSKAALAELVGHPLVFWEDSGVRLELLKGTPELQVLRGKGQKLTLKISPQPRANADWLLLEESPTRLKLIQIKDEHRRIAQVLGQKLQVPESVQERVLATIQNMASVVTVQSDIGGGQDNLESVPAVATPHFHLLPAGEGLKVALLCRPFGEEGPYYRPGKGGKLVIAELAGARKQTERDLAAEKQQAKAAVAACSTLEAYPAKSGEWQIEEPEDCLELLLELKSLGEQAIVEWPEGEKLRVNHEVSLDNLHLQIGQQKDWFAASGDLKVGDEQVLQMQQLLTLLEQAHSRFVPLGDGQFLALTQEFRKRLNELRAFSEINKKGVRFHPLASLALQDMMEEVGSVTADKQWKAHLKTLKEVQTLEPKLPSTLQAELRDYQLEGFEWLARLAHWGVGACLADDMGLGKTLQALAVILTRAPKGPTLVVAPTSVGHNWMTEAEKFAPTLKPVLLSAVSDRSATLEELQPFDLLVCTYGLLQQPEVGAMLAQRDWQTIVLDEAQAIKNSATQRSKAAMKLQGGFKLIATGTPIENHLGELWNQFRFINPGLLGSKEQFNKRFAAPIERQQDKAARQQLKALIQPFMLRRTKSQVLAELPSRTEMTLTVELSSEEMALYEALRREALEKLANSDADSGPKHLQILAEIMKLRRLCCNAKLVVPETPLPSAKLQVFSEVLSELLENHHKALVFSQFVDHLSILRDYLDEQQIAYQYLDGSTSAKQRKQRVNAFQAGEGDVFLISLKAGGTGLNLTAADYVIHMDPWWNPAVEDQASDRAHRIGQQRPVTIYRLVAQGTIEEKIVELHRHKRDLADSLLEGTDSSGKLSADELLQLIRED